MSQKKKKKIRNVFKKGHEKTDIYKEISSCVLQRFNGFSIIRHMLNKKEKEDFQLLDLFTNLLKQLIKLLNVILLIKLNSLIVQIFNKVKIVFNQYYCNVFVSG